MSTVIQAPRVKLLPVSDQPVQSVGFYQIDEDSLFVPIAPVTIRHKFFSFIESKHLRLDIDREGRLLFIEVSLPRHLWLHQAKPDLQDNSDVQPKYLAEPTKSAKIRWLDFRCRVANPQFKTDENRSFLDIIFLEGIPRQKVRLTSSVTLSITDDNRVASILVDQIIADKAGKELTAYRKENSPESSPSLSTDHC